jgi:hypothetical protein
MRLYEILSRSDLNSSPYLYHGTGLSQANSILETNTLQAGDMNLSSFSRHIGPAGTAPGGTGFGASVVFIIDRNLLRRDYGKKLKPISPAGYGRSEAEEGIKGDITNFSKYIKEIRIDTYDVSEIISSIEWKHESNNTPIPDYSNMEILDIIKIEYPSLMKDSRVVFKKVPRHYL